jgi:hypothetical protein
MIAYSRVCIVDLHTHTSTGTSFLVAQRYKTLNAIDESPPTATVSRISSSSSSLLGAVLLMKLKSNGKHDGTEGSLEQQIALLREKLQKQEEMITDLKFQKEVSHTNMAAPEKSANKSAKGEIEAKGEGEGTNKTVPGKSANKSKKGEGEGEEEKEGEGEGSRVSDTCQVVRTLFFTRPLPYESSPSPASPR